MKTPNRKNIIIVILTSVLITGAVFAYVPPVVTENTQHGLIIVDAGEWGEVLPYTPTAPQPGPTNSAPAPTQQPTSNGDPTSTPDICPAPEYAWVEVIKDRVPLREIAGFNDNGFPVWGIYGKSDVDARIVAKVGKLLCVWANTIKGDGGDFAFKLISSQIVDGDYLPGDQYLYILTRHVIGSQGP